MSEIGIKDQCFGVEVEMTGITREQAAHALADYFGTSPQYLGTGYDTWGATDPEGKVWKLMSDASIRADGQDIPQMPEPVTVWKWSHQNSPMKNFPNSRSVSVG